LGLVFFTRENGIHCAGYIEHHPPRVHIILCEFNDNIERWSALPLCAQLGAAVGTLCSRVP
jgi:hypothetical protein